LAKGKTKGLFFQVKELLPPPMFHLLPSLNFTNLVRSCSMSAWKQVCPLVLITHCTCGQWDDKSQTTLSFSSWFRGCSD